MQKFTTSVESFWDLDVDYVPTIMTTFTMYTTSATEAMVKFSCGDVLHDSGFILNV